jgi:hypothetical protein
MKIWLRFGVLIISIMLLYTGLLLFGARSCVFAFWPNDQFSSKDWRGNESLRYRQVQSLLSKTETLEGLNHDEVISILGTPDRLPIQSNLFIFKIRDLWPFGCGVNNIVELAIQFDTQGKAQKLELITD